MTEIKLFVFKLCSQLMFAWLATMVIFFEITQPYVRQQLLNEISRAFICEQNHHSTKHPAFKVNRHKFDCLCECRQHAEQKQRRLAYLTAACLFIVSLPMYIAYPVALVHGLVGFFVSIIVSFTVFVMVINLTANGYDSYITKGLLGVVIDTKNNYYAVGENKSQTNIPAIVSQTFTQNMSRKSHSAHD